MITGADSSVDGGEVTWDPEVALNLFIDKDTTYVNVSVMRPIQSGIGTQEIIKVAESLIEDDEEK